LSKFNNEKKIIFLFYFMGAFVVTWSGMFSRDILFILLSGNQSHNMVSRSFFSLYLIIRFILY